MPELSELPELSVPEGNRETPSYGANESCMSSNDDYVTEEAPMVPDLPGRSLSVSSEPNE